MKLIREVVFEGSRVRIKGVIPVTETSNRSSAVVAAERPTAVGDIAAKDIGACGRNLAVETRGLQDLRCRRMARSRRHSRCALDPDTVLCARMRKRRSYSRSPRSLIPACRSPRAFSTNVVYGLLAGPLLNVRTILSVDATTSRTLRR